VSVDGQGQMKLPFVPSGRAAYCSASMMPRVEHAEKLSPPGLAQGSEESPRFRPRAAEFFAGVGLVRLALTRAEVDVVWANDIDRIKKSIYEANWGSNDFFHGDIKDVDATRIPTVDVATASFPCTDLSLAGKRQGLAGKESGTFWAFIDVLEAMDGDGRLPPVVLCENVAGFATSERGDDLRSAISALNELGYSCDVVVANARWWLPQSRSRIFLVGSTNPRCRLTAVEASEARPQWVLDFWAQHSDLRHHWVAAKPPAKAEATLPEILVDVARDDPRWWDAKRLKAFLDSLSFSQTRRVLALSTRGSAQWRTAYRRTRSGVPRWEIRQDEIAGCLRTARGGSSKQAVVRIEGEDVKVRWMFPEEYAALQGAPGYKNGSASPTQVLFGYGDAVCVPAVEWVVNSFVRPHLGDLSADVEIPTPT
jgi:DNA (cytosine-5)-methyltransferase 1